MCDLNAALELLAGGIPASAAEAHHQDRIAAHAKRVQREDPGRQPVLCWACHKPCPGMPAKHGWVSRPMPTYHGPRIIEVFCAECFAEWGWGDGAAATEEAA